MSEFQGYKGKSLEYLKSNDLKVGDSVKIVSDLVYVGRLMPRYEESSEDKIVLKLENGYNIGIEIDKISSIEKTLTESKTIQQSDPIPINPSLPKILLLSTGGTIASKIDYRTGAVTPAITPKELNESVPELAKIANIESQILFSEYSENLQPQHWQSIAEKLDSFVDSDYQGIIVTHGTDTMQYTASFLSFALSGYPIPIALVGSQRSSDRPSSDAALNLIAATRFLLECNTNGVFVVMHQDKNDELVACHMGTRVRKMHTSKRGAFETIGGDPSFLISEEKIVKATNEKFFTTEKYNPRTKLDTSVALVKYYPGCDPKIIDFLINSKIKGIIFEGTGLGHVGKTMYDSIKKAHENGIFLGMTSQCIDGRVRMTVYESGRDLMNLGVIPLKDMISEVALVKAMWALGNSSNYEEFRELMLSKIASEFSD
jgi:glutamyl-tRNA(Gln) amidotransferase subunit D